MPAHVLFRRSIGNRCQKKWFYQDNLNRTTTVILLAIISLLVTEQESIILPWSFPAHWHLLPASASWSFSQSGSWTAVSEMGPILARDTRKSRICFHLTQIVIPALISKTGKVQKRKCFLASSLGFFLFCLLLKLILPKVLHLFSWTKCSELFLLKFFWIFWKIHLEGDF